MKTIKTVLGSAMLASMALAPVFALAEETTVTLTSDATVNVTPIVATTTAPVPTLYREAMEQKREAFKKLEEQKREELKNLREKTRGDIKDLREQGKEDRKDFRASSTASSSALREEMRKEREDNRQERRDQEMKRKMASTTERLLNLSTKLGKLGVDIKAAVEAQASSSLVITSSMSQVEARSALRTFFLGSDFKNLGQLVREAANTQERISQINNQITKMASSTDKAALEASVAELKTQAATLEQYVKDNEGKFSLFGWFTKRFNK